MIKKSVLISAIAISILSFSSITSTSAQEIPQEWKQNLELKYEYRHFKLNLNRYADQFFTKRAVDQNESVSPQPFGTPHLFCDLSEQTFTDTSPSQEIWDIDIPALEEFLAEDVAPRIDRERSDVTINRDENGNITFDGYGEFERKLNVPATAQLIATASKNAISKVTLAVDTQPPVVTVLDPELKERGIQDLISVGWSDFSGSPSNRRHNIRVGSSKLNGTMASQGEIYSIGNNLGPINGITGYKKELVILGNKTVPEYGGGACQFSTTFYRGLMLGGLPIEERRNHSYSVSYYHPVGTDLTIYPPAIDGKFQNDTTGDILIQTRMEGDELFFHYYGTRDNRKVYTLGPYISNQRPPLSPTYTTTTEIAPGKTRQLSAPHAGMDVHWYRLIKPDQANTQNMTPTNTTPDPLNQDIPVDNLPQEQWETYFSRYRSTGLWIETGVEPGSQSEQPESTETSEI